MADFDMDSNPWIMSRDNTGYIMINVKTIKAYQLAVSPISANLFGHGDILRITKIDAFRNRVITVLQNTDTDQAQLLSFQMAPAFAKALLLLTDK